MSQEMAHSRQVQKGNESVAPGIAWSRKDAIWVEHMMIDVEELEVEQAGPFRCGRSWHRWISGRVALTVVLK